MSDIVIAENPILKQIATEVPLADIPGEHIRGIIAHMKKTLSREPLGVAIAAPQIGESLRIFVVAGKVFMARKGEDAPAEPDRVYINPEVLKMSRKKEPMHEGCLSVRGSGPDMLLWGTVERAQKMRIRAYDEHGVQAEHKASGFLSQIFQHEIDHLEGILYTERAVHVQEEKDPSYGT
ncbi:MAG: peptide deformylase [Patescibacteria group bacterium]|mgnify:CR=1 FL=1